MMAFRCCCVHRPAALIVVSVAVIAVCSPAAASFIVRLGDYGHLDALSDVGGWPPQRRLQAFQVESLNGPISQNCSTAPWRVRALNTELFLELFYSLRTGLFRHCELRPPGRQTDRRCSCGCSRCSGSRPCQCLHFRFMIFIERIANERARSVTSINPQKMPAGTLQSSGTTCSVFVQEIASLPGDFLALASSPTL